MCAASNTVLMVMLNSILRCVLVNTLIPHLKVCFISTPSSSFYLLLVAGFIIIRNNTYAHIYIYYALIHISIKVLLKFFFLLRVLFPG